MIIFDNSLNYGTGQCTHVQIMAFVRKRGRASKPTVSQLSVNCPSTVSPQITNRLSTSLLTGFGQLVCVLFCVGHLFTTVGLQLTNRQLKDS